MAVFDPTSVLPPDLFGRPLLPGGVSAANAAAPPSSGGGPAQSLSDALAAAGNPAEGSTAFNLIKFPNSLWGGNDNVASKTPPDWLKQLVATYLQNPSHDRWNHILNGPYGAPYNTVSMPDWLKSWLVGALGPDPAVASRGGV